MGKIIQLFIVSLALASPSSFAEGIIIYHPPTIDAPDSRVGAGTRGSTKSAPLIQVLAPAHTALTGQAQPILYWYLLEDNQNIIEITLTQEGAEEPVLEKQLSAPVKKGLHKIRLADEGVSLRPNEEYLWSVAIVTDSQQRSNDIVAGATIRYRLPAAPLSSVEQQAAAGYWYDALQTLIETQYSLVGRLLEQVDIQIPSE